jgi:hypothetical protein
MLKEWGRCIKMNKKRRNRKKKILKKEKKMMSIQVWMKR